MSRIRGPADLAFRLLEDFFSLPTRRSGLGPRKNKCSGSEAGS